MRPHLQKITRAKWTGDVAQAIKHLLCKCEALSSNTSPIKKKKRKKERKEIRSQTIHNSQVMETAKMPHH
jgi:hypothetical protein